MVATKSSVRYLYALPALAEDGTLSTQVCREKPMYIHGKAPILRKLITQVRFVDGFAYWDLRGRIINEVRRQHPGWVVEAPFGGNQTRLRDLVSGCLVVFTEDFVSVTMNASEDEKDGLSTDRRDEFLAILGVMSSRIMDELGVHEVTRVGTRGWFWFDMPSEAEANAWVKKLHVAAPAPTIAKAISGELLLPAVQFIYQVDDRTKLRLAVDVARGRSTIKGKHYSAFVDSGTDAIRKDDYAAVESAGGGVVGSHAVVVDIDVSGTIDENGSTTFAKSAFELFYAVLDGISKAGA